MTLFRLHSPFCFVFSLLMLVSGSVACAQTETVEAEIVSVNLAAGSVELSYQAALGKTQSTLDVSKKAKITINGEPGTFESLQKGQKATVIYNTELAVVTSIQATGMGDPQAAELVRLDDLNGSFATLTADGLTICYEAQGEGEPLLMMAQRNSTKVSFENPQLLFPGRHPALSGDGLELVFLQIAPGKKTRTLHVATRQASTAPFGKSLEIRELSAIDYPRGLFLTEDGLTLCFRTSKETSELVSCRRTSRTSAWTSPKPLLASSVEHKLGGQLTWPWISADGLKLLAVLETGGKSTSKPNLYRLKRASIDQPFSDPALIENAAISFMVRAPRYLPQTGELFVSGVPRTAQAFGIGVVKGFDLPE
ncbi:hypothetical protein [Planctomicrobium sp. SH527]|uniref:hypothetical protein n=1 Tax=Planctomicrobium sp. SH527 TaxID=3448123 RepID=UPI003F5B5587